MPSVAAYNNLLLLCLHETTVVSHCRNGWNL